MDAFVIIIKNIYFIGWGYGGMVDATDLKSVVRKDVRVQVPLSPFLSDRLF